VKLLTLEFFTNSIFLNFSLDRGNIGCPLPSHHDGIEGIKGYIRGSVKDMQSLLKDPENNIPLPEDQFTKVEDERVISRCNFRKVCRGKREEGRVRIS